MPVFVIFIFSQDFLADIVQGFAILDQFDDLVAIGEFLAILLDKLKPCHAGDDLVNNFLAHLLD